MLDQVAGNSQDVDLERLLVALLFERPGAIESVGNLTEDDFTQPELGGIYLACADAHARGTKISAVNLLPRLQGITSFDGENGLAIIRSITVSRNPPKIEDVAKRLHDLAERRRASDYLQTIAQTALDESMSLKALVGDATRHLESVTEDGVEDQHGGKDLHTLALNFIEYLQSPEPEIEITTGFLDLDAATGGWHRGQFSIIAGRPSMGKSTFALSSLLRTADAGHGVLFFSLEMPETQIAARALTDFAYTDPVIAYSDLRPRRSAAHIRRLSDASERFANLPLIVDTRQGLTVERMLERVALAKKHFEAMGRSLDLVVADHMLKIVPSDRYAGNPTKELDEVSEGMTVIAKKHKVAAVGLHQLSRGTEQRDNKRPVMSDLRGSGTLEQDADLILFCYRPAYQVERLKGAEENDEERFANQAIADVLKYDFELQIAKQRNGPTTRVDLWADMAANAVRNKGFR